MPLHPDDRTYLFKMVTRNGGVHTFFPTAVGQIYKFCIDSDGEDGDVVVDLIGSLSLPDLRNYRRAIQLLYELYPGVDETADGLITYRGFSLRQNAPALLRRAKDAMSQVRKVSTECVKYLQYVTPKTGTPKTGYGKSASPNLSEFANATYELWFDFLREAKYLDVVRGLMKKLENAVNNQSFEVVCDSDPLNVEGAVRYVNGKADSADVNGFVMPAENRRRFYACSSFFNELSSEIDRTPCSYVRQPRNQTYAATRDAVYSALNASTITCLHELTHITAIGGTEDVDNDYTEAHCKRLAINRRAEAVKNAENYALFAKAVLQRMLFKK